MTGWFTRTPSPEPLSIFTLEYQTVGERAITRAATRLVPDGNMSLALKPTRGALSWAASRSAVCDAASSERSRSTSARSSVLSPLASKVSPTQLNEVAHGLEGAAGAGLDRRERLLGYVTLPARPPERSPVG